MEHKTEQLKAKLHIPFWLQVKMFFGVQLTSKEYFKALSKTVTQNVADDMQSKIAVPVLCVFAEYGIDESDNREFVKYNTFRIPKLPGVVKEYELRRRTLEVLKALIHDLEEEKQNQ